jgi:hypothetical protein
VRWEGGKLAKFDPELQSEAAKVFEQILGDDKHCAPERST